MITKIAIIREIGDGKYRLYSRKKDSQGHRRNLGTFDSLSAAKKHEQQVQWFKHHAEDGADDDKQTKALSKISNIAQYLEEAGFIDKAKELYNTMALIDQSLDDTDYLVDHFQVPENQLNTENQGYIGGDGTAGGYSMLSLPGAVIGAKDLKMLVKMANDLDQSGNTELADKIDDIIKGLGPVPTKKPIKKKKKVEDSGESVDNVAGANGHMGVTVTDNGGAGQFSVLNDSYFYRQYGDLEGAYGPQ